MQILTDRHPVYIQKYNLSVSSLIGHTQYRTPNGITKCTLYSCQYAQ